MNIPNTSNIGRPLYLKKIMPFAGQNIIKVFTGQRRVGKSYLLFQVMEKIRELHANTDILYINKELDTFSDITDYRSLLNFIKKNKKKRTGLAYLFIDEIQDIKEFERALRSLQAEGGYDIYCTGSNANLLSGELATYLSGRYVEIKVYGLSYNEFLSFHSLENHIDSFNKYLQYGGLPYLINLPLEETVVYDYLKNIYHTVLFKDVVRRFNVRNIPFLENLVRYLCDNTGSLVSAKRISDFLKSQQIKISPQVVLNYLSYLESSFLVYKVKRSGISGKKIFEIGEKYYFEDLGIRNSIAGYKITDIHKIIENIVFLHLSIAGYKINVGKTGDKEIDFVCEKSGEKIYIQVCYLLSDQKTIRREFNNLLEIQDNYPKYVVSMDTTSKTSIEGIIQKHVMDFCKEI